MSVIQYLTTPHGKLAYQFYQGSSSLPPIVFLCGFKSDMNGSKAEWLHTYCVENDRTYLRFDYFAHGQSDGNFMDFTIGHGVMDSLFIINQLIDRPAVLIGSSMGGWIGMRLLQFMPEHIRAFIGLAAAPDFTRKIYSMLDDGNLAQLSQNGYISQPSDYDEPYIFTQALFTDGENQCVLDSKIAFNGPIYLMQGKLDNAVDWHVPESINTCFGGQADITLIDDGDHSLSRPQDLALLKSLIEKIPS